MCMAARYSAEQSGNLNWDGGSISGALRLPRTLRFNIIPGGGNGIKGLVFTNNGTVNWSNTTIYSYGPSNAQIYNFGTWNAQTDNQFQGGFSGGTTLFQNYGIFVKSSGANTTSLDADVAFNNMGQVGAAERNGAHWHGNRRRRDFCHRERREPVFFAGRL